MIAIVGPFVTMNNMLGNNTETARKVNLTSIATAKNCCAIVTILLKTATVHSGVSWIQRLVSQVDHTGHGMWRRDNSWNYYIKSSTGIYASLVASCTNKRALSATPPLSNTPPSTSSPSSIQFTHTHTLILRAGLHLRRSAVVAVAVAGGALVRGRVDVVALLVQVVAANVRGRAGGRDAGL